MWFASFFRSDSCRRDVTVDFQCLSFPRIFILANAMSAYVAHEVRAHGFLGFLFLFSCPERLVRRRATAAVFPPVFLQQCAGAAFWFDGMII